MDVIFAQLTQTLSRPLREPEAVTPLLVLSCFVCWLHGHERCQRDIKFANDAGRLKGKMGFASKFANKTLLDQSRSKTLPRGHLNGRATSLHLRKAKSLLRGVNSRRYRHTAIGVR